MVLPAINVSSNITVSTNITATSSPQIHKQKPLNSTLKSLSKSGKLDKAIRLIESLPSKLATIEPDLEAYSALLHACISRKSLEHGQRLYLQLLLSRDRGDHNLLTNPTLKSKLITLYSVCGRVDEACRIFEDGLEAEHAPESVWVAMAIGYSKNGHSKEALLLYCEMLCRSVQPSNFSFSTALKACSDLFELRVGRAVHAQMLKSNEEPDQVVYNALLQLYKQCGCYEEVLQVFEVMPQRNIVSWNSLISGFVQRDQLFEAVDTFRRLQGEKLGFSWVTLTTILPVCARVTALYSGKEIHAQIVKSIAKPDVPVINSLMNMYAKCGAMDYCKRVFDGMQTMEGLQMRGRRLFDRMNLEFGVSPTSEHYACLVDILGRAGRIKEALEVVKNMPMKPSGSIWGSLLNACRLYGDVSLAEIIAKQLFELEPNNPGNYVVLSNIYANAGMWEGVRMVREMMEKRAIKKEAGCSWIQVKNRIHNFVAGGGFEFRSSDEYKKVWNELMEAMEEVGYVPDTRVVLHDVNEEIKAMWVCGHSERLAAMFGLIHTNCGIPIRITKNLRSYLPHSSSVAFDTEVWQASLSALNEDECACDFLIN
ncbi:hypothetical protein F0562_004106 [Nyssa sinensis]|uniref:DYW domain-containing protein n=1 Tax=Nyssa sinensis TaxID=561372 RepID=A0A5J5C169_9ASTE|nr:hypothetical protein F0562_004106 [Nyssa sinensis]